MGPHEGFGNWDRDMMGCGGIDYGWDAMGYGGTG